MSTAVHFGAGNIGRGFLGQLYWQSGWETVFVDVIEDVVRALNERHGYGIHIIDEHPEVIAIDRVRALHGRDAQAVAEAVAACDLASTAVGVRVLDHVVPPLAAGLRLRAAARCRPLNIIVCENLLDAASTLRRKILDAADAATRAFISECVGFVSTVVSRMVPVVPPEVRVRDPLYVAVEAYATLPVDATAFVGGVPAVRALLPVANIAAHEERKLFCHNCGHALCAYLGHPRGHRLIADAIAAADVRARVLAGLDETGQALIAKHGFDPAEHRAHVADLLRRFANRALGDTVARVLARPDPQARPPRLVVGAAELCLDQGVEPDALVEGIRAALGYDAPDDPEAVRLQAMLRGDGIEAVLAGVCGLQPSEPLYGRIRRSL